jgi:hypothetical protein
MRNLDKSEMSVISGGKGAVGKILVGVVTKIVGKKIIAEIKKNVNPQVKPVKKA